MDEVDVEALDTSLVAATLVPTQVVADLDPPVVLVLAPTTPVLVVQVIQTGVLTAPALQGAAGPEGPPGPVFNGFGFIRYFELGGASATPLVLAPNVRTPFTMVNDPAQTVNALKDPFANQTFWDGTTLNAQTLNDTMDVQLTFSAVSTVSGGNVLVEMQYAGDGGPIRAQVCDLPAQAGSTQRIFVIFKLFGSALLLAQGAQFYLTSSVPLSLVQETMLIEPTNAGP